MKLPSRSENKGKVIKIALAVLPKTPDQEQINDYMKVVDKVDSRKVIHEWIKYEREITNKPTVEDYSIFRDIIITCFS